MHIWEVATWEIDGWEVALGEMPLGKYLIEKVLKEISPNIFKSKVTFFFLLSDIWVELGNIMEIKLVKNFTI